MTLSPEIEGKVSDPDAEYPYEIILNDVETGEQTGLAQAKTFDDLVDLFEAMRAAITVLVR